MSEVWSYLGGALLVGATLPQAVRLVRTRRVGDFSVGFIVLNVLGLSLLAIRSAEIREYGFLAINGFTTLFWVVVGFLKLAELDEDPALPVRRADAGEVV